MNSRREVVVSTPPVDLPRQRIGALVNLIQVLTVTGEPQDSTQSKPRTNPTRDALIHAYTALRVRTFLESGIHDPSSRAEAKLSAFIKARSAADGSYAFAYSRVAGIIADLVRSAPDEDDHMRKLTALEDIRRKALEVAPNLKLSEEAGKLVEQLGTR